MLKTQHQQKVLFRLLVLLYCFVTVHTGATCTDVSPLDEDYLRCIDALSDERTHLETFYTTWGGAVASSISGSISVICSATLMYLITKKSEIGLKSVYHRIIFGMSIADITCSLSYTVSSLPMPHDMIYEQFQSLTIGNEFTCSIQGFAQFFGSRWQMNYSAVLSLYYLHSIRYKTQDEDLRKCIEPIWHILAFLVAIPAPMISLAFNMYNPTPFEVWCTKETLPYYCDTMNIDTEFGREDCVVRGKSFLNHRIDQFQFIHTLVTLFLMLVPMCLIILSVRKQESYIKATIRRMYGTSRIGEHAMDGRLAMTQRRHNYTKVMSIQAAAYIITFLIPPMSAMVHPFQLFGEQSHKVQMFHVVVMPLQGLFTFIIFVTQKAYDNHRMDPTLPYRKAITDVFTKKEQTRYLISRISIVRVYEDGISSHSDGDDGGGNNHAVQERYYFEGAVEEGNDNDDNDDEEVGEEVELVKANGNGSGNQDEKETNSAKNDNAHLPTRSSCTIARQLSHIHARAENGNEPSTEEVSSDSFISSGEDTSKERDQKTKGSTLCSSGTGSRIGLKFRSSLGSSNITTNDTPAVTATVKDKSPSDSSAVALRIGPGSARVSTGENDEVDMSSFIVSLPSSTDSASHALSRGDISIDGLVSEPSQRGKFGKKFRSMIRTSNQMKTKSNDKNKASNGTTPFNPMDLMLKNADVSLGGSPSFVNSEGGGGYSADGYSNSIQSQSLGGLDNGDSAAADDDDMFDMMTVSSR